MAAPTASPTVPVIDISALGIGPTGLGGRSGHGDGQRTAERVATVAALGAACRDVGFLSVVGHGIDPARRDAAFEASRRFFDLPPEVKASVAMDHDGPHAERGYDGLGHQRLDDDADPDRKESFNAGPDLPADHPLVVAGTPMHGLNRWLPDEVLPGFRATATAYQQALAAIARGLLGAMAESLDLDPGYFEPFQTVPAGALRLTHYPPRRDEAGPAEFGAGAHTDWGALTVLAQDDAGGLQVQHADGTWIDVTPEPDALVVNIGDLLERWTNGMFRSTRHRVLGADRDRYSIVCFYDVDWYTTVECLPTCVSAERPARYPVTTVGEHLLGKFNASVVATPA